MPMVHQLSDAGYRLVLALQDIVAPLPSDGAAAAGRPGRGRGRPRAGRDARDRGQGHHLRASGAVAARRSGCSASCEALLAATVADALVRARPGRRRGAAPHRGGVRRAPPAPLDGGRRRLPATSWSGCPSCQPPAVGAAGPDAPGAAAPRPVEADPALTAVAAGRRDQVGVCAKLPGSAPRGRSDRLSAGICRLPGRHASWLSAAKSVGRGRRSAATSVTRTTSRPRRFNPNLQTVRAVVNGGTKRMRVCTRCIRVEQGRQGRLSAGACR